MYEHPQGVFQDKTKALSNIVQDLGSSTENMCDVGGNSKADYIGTVEYTSTMIDNVTPPSTPNETMVCVSVQASYLRPPEEVPLEPPDVIDPLDLELPHCILPQMSVLCIDTLLYTLDLPSGNNKGMDHPCVRSLVIGPSHELVSKDTDSSALITDVDQQAISKKSLLQFYTVSYFRPPEDVPLEPPPREDIPPEPPPSVVLSMSLINV